MGGTCWLWSFQSQKARRNELTEATLEIEDENRIAIIHMLRAVSRLPESNSEVLSPHSQKGLVAITSIHEFGYSPSFLDRLVIKGHSASQNSPVFSRWRAVLRGTVSACSQIRKRACSFIPVDGFLNPQST